MNGLIAAVLAWSVFAPTLDDPIRLTSRDVDESNKKAVMAYNALVSMWTNEFRTVGARFVAPRLVRYRDAVRTACGVMAPENAAYCYNANTIYFDDVFVAAQAKRAASELGTDGDMTAVGIIAHEMGHAVAMQLGFRARSSYENEAVADCFAGAFARQAEKDGSLERGDVEEAFWGMAAAGDPEIQLTGNRRYDARIQSRLRRSAHGTADQRQENFRAGLDGGSAACLSDFANT